jgi:hypothetical protein
MPKVFVIILHWNNQSDTLECLESLKKIDYPNYQVVVIDNGSKEKFRVQRLDLNGTEGSKVKIIYNQKNLGFAGGNNVGIRYALEKGADYVLLLNNDTIVSQDFLKKLVDSGESNKKIGLLGPKIYFVPYQRFLSVQGFADDSQRIWFAGGQINWLSNQGKMKGYGEIDRGHYDHPPVQETEYITGCCLLIKRAVVEKIGLLPEDYFLYYEDTAWSLEARRAGYKCIFVPAAMA